MKSDSILLPDSFNCCGQQYRITDELELCLG